MLERGNAAWCPAVRLELWNGAGNESDRRILRKAGKTAPAIDVLIAACARHHGVELEHADAHFEFLMAL